MQGIVEGDYFRGRNQGALRSDYSFKREHARLIPGSSRRAQHLISEYVGEAAQPVLPLQPGRTHAQAVEEAMAECELLLGSLGEEDFSLHLGLGGQQIGRASCRERV